MSVNNATYRTIEFSIHDWPDVFVCLVLSTNIGIAVATFHFLIPIYVYDLLGREFRAKADSVLAIQFASGVLYQYIMSEYIVYFFVIPFIPL